MSKKETQLDLFEKESLPIIYPVSDTAIQKISSNVADLDIRTKDGYELAKKSIAECRSLRGKVETRRKELNSDILKRKKNIDDAAKKILSAILEVEAPLKEIKDSFDREKEMLALEAARKEQDRIASIDGKVARLEQLGQVLFNSTVEDVEAKIEELNSINISCEEYQELTEVALKEANRASGILENALIQLKEIRALKEKIIPNQTVATPIEMPTETPQVFPQATEVVSAKPCGLSELLSDVDGSFKACLMRHHKQCKYGFTFAQLYDKFKKDILEWMENNR